MRKNNLLIIFIVNDIQKVLHTILSNYFQLNNQDNSEYNYGIIYMRKSYSMYF